MSQEPQDLNDPLEIMKQPQDTKTLLKESLNAFEKEIWPIYEARGYDKNTALLSYSIGIMSDIVTDFLDCDCDDCKTEKDD